jgi:hypothetical protein
MNETNMNFGVQNSQKGMNEDKIESHYSNHLD